MTVWKLSAESRYPGAFPPVLENFPRAFSPARLTAPGSPRMNKYWSAGKSLHRGLSDFVQIASHLCSIILLLLIEEFTLFVTSLQEIQMFVSELKAKLVILVGGGLIKRFTCAIVRHPLSLYVST